MMQGLIVQNNVALTVQRQCQLAGIARSSYYRRLQGMHRNDPEEMELRDQIQQICVEMHRYGYRRVTAELHRRGYRVNHKHVLALMRKDNLLCMRKKHWVCTTNSSHAYRVYPNLAKNLVVTHLNQLWVADITYVHLEREFVYLAIILDTFSRRAIGWALRRHLDTELSRSALQMALATRTVGSDLIHHSDRGVQYAAGDYIDMLTKNSIVISMSRRGNPYDNAYAESFMKTLKHEEVLLNEYETFDEATANIRRFIEMVYNSKRLHSSLGYRPPVEFETDSINLLNQKSSTLTTGMTVSF
jgi:transposase InsO family protein